MQKNNVKPENHLVIHGWMLTDLHLKGNELLIYACIYGYSQNKAGCFYGSLQYLADWTNSTKRGVMKCLNGLLDKCLIEKFEEYRGGVKFVLYRTTDANLDMEQSSQVWNKVHRGMEQSSPGGEQSSMGVWNKVHRGMEQSSPNNIDNNIPDIIDDKIEDKSPHTHQGVPTPENRKREKAVIPTQGETGFSDRLHWSFAMWIEYKKEQHRYIYKPTGLKSLVTVIRNNVDKYGEDAVCCLITECMSNGWKGIIWDKLKGVKEETGKKPYEYDPGSMEGSL